jgi:hypothetical protein
MATVVVVLTLCVVTVKVALVAPAGTVTLAGTVAALVLLLTSETTAPPAGAATFRVAVPVELAPPATLPGLTVTACSAGAGGGVGITVSVPVTVVPPAVAEIVTEVFAVTGVVVTVKDAATPAPPMLAEGGTLATDGLLLCSVTVMPPGGAGVAMRTVPVQPFVPLVVAGSNETEVGTSGGSIFNCTETVAPFQLAVNVTVVMAVTVPVVTLIGAE